MDNKDMKKRRVFVCAILCVCFLSAVYDAAETTTGDEPISLNIENRPLGEVLATISKITGHAFIIDPQWLDMPVSISVEATPLHKALKIIFTDTNNAIIYKSDGNIKVIIYSDTAEQDKGAVSPTTGSQQESDSLPETVQESGSAEEAGSETETDNSAGSGEEDVTQPDKDQESADEQNENTTEEASEEQGESTKADTD
jgi:type II secretory pathway component GspD/PulD (secretin)